MNVRRNLRVRDISGLIESRLWAQILVAMVVGVGLGLLLSPQTEGPFSLSPEDAEIWADWLRLPGQLFLNVIQMVVIPLVITSIILGLTSAGDPAFLRKVGLRIAPYFVGTTTLAVLLGALVATTIKPGRFIDGAGFTSEAVSAAGEVMEAPAALASVPDQIANLVPANIDNAMLTGNMLQIVVYALFIGVAMSIIGPDRSEPLSRLLQTVQEVAMNTAAENVAKNTGHQIMSRAHGCWSLGTLAGALVGSGFILAEIDMWEHFLMLMPITVIAGVWASTGLQDGEKSPETSEDVTSGPFKLPRKSIMLLCLMPVGIMLVEGAFIDWSAIFVKSVLLAGPIATGLIYSAFSLVMALTRLNGDWLIEKFGAVRVARISAISGTVGIALFAVSPNTTVAFVAALLSGLGVAIIYPICVTAAARRPGNAEDNVAALSLFAFCSFMIAPPIIGFVTDWTGLRIGLLLIVPLAASSYFLSGELEKKASDR